MKNNITIICKPTHECNMNCEYCYDKEEKKLVKNKYMNFDTLEQAIKISLKSYKNINWIWHGGEATLMGKHFFKKALEIFDKYKTPEHNITMLTQSNGKNSKETRVWLKELNIQPGYSFDIIDDNKHRNIDINILDYIEKDDGIISVISEPNIDLIEPFVKYSVNDSERGIAFNKIFLLDKNKKYNVKGMVDSFIKLFDYILWNKDIKVEKNIEDYIKMICLNKDILCNLKQCLGNMLSINPDGIIMFCDSFSMKDTRYHLGNVKDYNEITECFSSEGFINSIKDDFEFRRNNCEKCEINMFCKNICKNSRINSNGVRDLKKQNKYECEFRIILINHIFNTLFNLSKKDLEKINKNIYHMLMERKFIFKFIIDEVKEILK